MEVASLPFTEVAFLPLIERQPTTSGLVSPPIVVLAFSSLSQKINPTLLEETVITSPEALAMQDNAGSLQT